LQPCAFRLNFRANLKAFILAFFAVICSDLDGSITLKELLNQLIPIKN